MCACVPGFEGKNCSIGKLSNNFDQPILLFKSQKKCFLGVVLNNNVRWTSENIICYLISLFFLFSDIDDCDPYPCLNNGACIDGVNNYTCACSSGFEGRNCSISNFFFYYYYYIYNVGVFILKYEFGQLPVTITNNSLGRKEGDAASVSFFFYRRNFSKRLKVKVRCRRFQVSVDQMVGSSILLRFLPL